MSLPGLAQCVIANRVSLFLGCAGPSMAVDTACASTLTVLESGVAAIESGRCDVAIAGATNPLLIPETSVGYDEMGVLAPDGVCKAFDAHANGYARSEGYGVVVLRKLSSALQAGNPVHGVIRGVRNSHCGYTSGGLTKPSRSAQAELIRDAWRRPGSAKGRGLRRGPRDRNGIAKAFGGGGGGGGKKKVPIASSKATFGHIEPAAACVSLVEACLMIDRKTLLPQANWTQANPDMKLITIGINAFGFGGSNSHCIVQEYRDPRRAVAPGGGSSSWCFGGGGYSSRAQQQQQQQQEQEQGRPACVPLSAASAAGLSELVAKWADAEIPEASAAGVVAWLVKHCSHLQQRCCIVASSSGEFGEEALKWSSGEPRPGGGTYRLAKQASALVVFAGQGQQHADMGRELCATFEIFRATVDERRDSSEGVARLVLGEDGILPRGVARLRDLNEPADSVSIICFYHCAPRVVGRRCVVGHSLGKIAAAFASGRCSFRDDGPPRSARLRTFCTHALNSPQSVTMSGDKKQCARLEELCKQIYAPQSSDPPAPTTRPTSRTRKRNSSTSFDGPSTFSTTEKARRRIPAIRWFSTVTGDEAEATVTLTSGSPSTSRAASKAALLSAAETDDCDCAVEIAARPTLGANVSQMSAGLFKKDPPPVFGLDSKTRPNQTETEALLLVGALNATSFDLGARLNGASEVKAPADAKTAAFRDSRGRRLPQGHQKKSWELTSYVPSAAEHVVSGNAIVPAVLELVLETLGASQRLYWKTSRSSPRFRCLLLRTIHVLNARRNDETSSWRYADKDQIYARCKAMGFDYGPRGARRATSATTKRTRTSTPPTVKLAGGGFRWHPPSPASAKFDIVVTYAEDLTMPLSAVHSLFYVESHLLDAAEFDSNQIAAAFNYRRDISSHSGRPRRGRPGVRDRTPTDLAATRPKYETPALSSGGGTPDAPGRDYARRRQLPERPRGSSPTISVESTATTRRSRSMLGVQSRCPESPASEKDELPATSSMMMLEPRRRTTSTTPIVFADPDESVPETEGIELRAAAKCAELADEMIEIAAAALNFKDVVVSFSGLLEKLEVAASGARAGCRKKNNNSNFSGEEFEESSSLGSSSLLSSPLLSRGHPVVALASGCVATKVNLDPGPCSWACVATYATAFDALAFRGKLKSGNVVVVHSAASAVGQAALHLAARSGGGCVFATSGF
ncbi:hypothetical protein CTAYLR_003444 [Chrysophaeum taylorii]|uniref:Ketosynthase family 3 (KS3) domain-containing protein n=1 Tax=Chrysophaeum taylorii TaxID=2483200 RepID=A0AAD7UAG2_9STRA|nr:hypothetical protein CTAYLR_003444 [Chrysophaeum taylorii]